MPSKPGVLLRPPPRVDEVESAPAVAAGGGATASPAAAGCLPHPLDLGGAISTPRPAMRARHQRILRSPVTTCRKKPRGVVVRKRNCHGAAVVTGVWRRASGATTPERPRAVRHTLGHPVPDLIHEGAHDGRGALSKWLQSRGCRLMLVESSNQVESRNGCQMAIQIAWAPQRKARHFRRARSKTVALPRNCCASFPLRNTASPEEEEEVVGSPISVLVERRRTQKRLEDWAATMAEATVRWGLVSSSARSQ